MIEISEERKKGEFEFKIRHNETYLANSTEQREAIINALNGISRILVEIRKYEIKKVKRGE